MTARTTAICGSATLAIAVSSRSMKVARVTTMATIHGLTVGWVAPTLGTEMVAAAALTEVPARFDATRDRSVASNVCYHAISDQLVADLGWRVGWYEQRRTDSPGNHSQ